MSKDPKDGPIENTHPSYGMVQFSRWSGASMRPLFGSSLSTHYSAIRLTVQPAIWLHDLHEDRYFGQGRDLIEVEMSAAQFAELITTMNMGSGVPCTIRRFDGRQLEEPPDLETEVQRVKSKFADDLKDMAGVMAERRASIEKLVAKLPDKTKQQIKIELDVIIQQLSSNIPFILEQFNEASERVVTAAKQEIEAFALHRVQTAGLVALGVDVNKAPRLPEGPLEYHQTGAMTSCDAVGDEGCCDPECRQCHPKVD